MSKTSSTTFDQPPAEQTFLGHPRGLIILFFTEMWERFSYYGMRGLLIIYLTQHFLFSDERSSFIYGAYISLVYVMSIFGGMLADKYLGQRKAVAFGAVLLVIGHFGMAFEGTGSRQIITYQGQEYQLILEGRGGDAIQKIKTGEKTSPVRFEDKGSVMVIVNPDEVDLPQNIPTKDYTSRIEQQPLYINILYISLAFIIAGVGFLKPNISTIVGALYGVGDPRRDSGFTFFYMGINLGSFLSAWTCGVIGIVWGWKWGFGLAGLGMLFGLVTFLSLQSWLKGKAEPPQPDLLKKRVLGFINIEYMCYLSALIIIAVSVLLIMNAHIVGTLMGWIGVLVLAGMLLYCFLKLKGDSRYKMLAALYFALAQIPFWSLFEQAGASLNLFTDRLVDRVILGWSVPAPVFQSLNGGFIFIFAPVVAWMWVWLAKRHLEPSTPVKFSLGVFGVGLGFLALVWGIKGTGFGVLTPVYFIFLIYWIHTMAELMLSPVGLSAMTKLAPAEAAGLTMGVWFLYSGLSNALAGTIAAMTGAETIGGQIIDAASAQANYAMVYSNVAYVAIAVAFVMLLISPFVKKWMREHG